MDDFHKKAAITALKNMFEGRHFSICTVDNVLKLSGCIPNRKDYEALSALHCVEWINMDDDLRKMVMIKTVQMFDTPGFDTEALNGVLKEQNILRIN